MSVTTVGDLTIAEMPGSVLSVNDFGLDELTRTFMGLSTYLISFTNGLVGRADTEYPQLKCTNYRVRYTEGNLVEIEATYKGLLQGSPRPPTIINEVGLNNLDFVYTDSGGGKHPFNASYYAPRTTYRYSLSYRPLAPIYSAIQTTNFEIRPFNPHPRPPTILENQIVTNRTTKDFVSSFRTEQQGNYFECEETIERILLDYTANDP